VSQVVQPWNPDLVWSLATGVLWFAAFCVLLSGVLLWRANASADHVLRSVGVISIVAFSAVLLIVGYNNEQLTPIIGLFGAIAGYLLGKESKGPSKGE